MIQDHTADTLRPQGPQILVPMTQMPGVPALFGKLLALAMVRSPNLSLDTHLKNACIIFRNHRIDKDKLRGFKQVCGYDPDTDSMPAPFIQTLFIGLVSKFIGSPYFPITPMGLIQVSQSFELKQALSAEIPLDLFCRLLDMTQTDRGIHTRFSMEAKISQGEDDALPVWQGVATYFTRAKHPGPKNIKKREDIPLPLEETMGVPENTGRQYAAVSGDYNPHHLYGWTARFMGFKQAIAHGMWSLARSCANLEKAFGYPETFELEGEFKLPIFLPATITLGIAPRQDGARFELRDQDQKLPHLKGSFRF